MAATAFTRSSDPVPRQPAIGRIALVVVLAGWLVVQIYPVVFLFMTSLKTDADILNAPFAPPLPPVFDSYWRIWSGSRTSQSFLIYFMNSVIVTAGSLILLLAVSALAGYALARGRFPGSALAQQVFLLSLAVPVHVLLIPIYFLFGELGLRNSLIGMILLYATLGLPFTTILMRAYFLSFPHELEEAARIDGCSRFTAFLRVVLPVSRGALASMAIINKLGVRTLPIAVAAYKPGSMATESVVGDLFAIMSLTVLPLIVFYFVFQKQIRKGMTAGAVK